jgi:hypothetical protein
MKRALIILSLSLVTAATFAQGLVNFYNSQATLFNTVIYPGYGTPVSLDWTPGNFYFGLLTAPIGTSDPRQFSFSGVYATNMGMPGRFSGGGAVSVPGWMPGENRSFLVAAWSANLGHNWNESWMHDVPPGLWSLSSIGTGVAGGWNIGPIPPLYLFGGATGIQTGWGFAIIPEPSAVSLATLAAATLLLRRRKKSKGASRH